MHSLLPLLALLALSELSLFGCGPRAPATAYPGSSVEADAGAMSASPRSPDASIHFDTIASRLSQPDEVNQNMGAYAYEIGNPGQPSVDAGTYSVTTFCTDQSAGGVDGCTNTSTHTCTCCLQRSSMYDSPNLEENDTNDTNNVYCLTAACQTDPWSSEPTWETNAYNFFGDNALTGGMRSYHQWGSNFFPSPVTTYQFWVNIETNYAGGVYCSNGSGAIEGIYTPFDHKLCLTQSPSNNFNGATNMFTMSREYGHAIHDFYGFYGTVAVDEGWADSNYLRVLLYWSQIGLNDWANLNYSTTLWNNNSGFVAQHGDKLVNAEHVLSEVVSGTSGSFYSPAAGCNANQDYSGNPWQCGSVISLVFWELAWNTAQTSYNGLAVGSQIMGTSGPYSPMQLALSAFAKALADTWTYGTSTEPVDAFLLDADNYYTNNFYANGYLSAGDLANVHSIFAHHCTGSANHCADGSFKNPTSPLPEAYTTKGALYFEAENETLNSHDTTVTANNAASGNKYVAATFANSNPGTVTVSNISLAPGTYQVAVSTHQSTSGGTAHWAYRWDSQIYRDAGSVPYNSGNWQWLTGSTTLVVTSQSTHSIAVKASNAGTIDIDVIVLNKQ